MIKRFENFEFNEDWEEEEPIKNLKDFIYDCTNDTSILEPWSNVKYVIHVNNLDKFNKELEEIGFSHRTKNSGYYCLFYNNNKNTEKYYVGLPSLPPYKDRIIIEYD